VSSFPNGHPLNLCTDELSARRQFEFQRHSNSMLKPSLMSKSPNLGKKHQTIKSECGAKYLA